MRTFQFNVYIDMYLFVCLYILAQFKVFFQQLPETLLKHTELHKIFWVVLKLRAVY